MSSSDMVCKVCAWCFTRCCRCCL